MFIFSLTIFMLLCDDDRRGADGEREVAVLPLGLRLWLPAQDPHLSEPAPGTIPYHFTLLLMLPAQDPHLSEIASGILPPSSYVILLPWLPAQDPQLSEPAPGILPYPSTLLLC